LLSALLILCFCCSSSDDSSEPTDSRTSEEDTTSLNNWPENDQRYEPIPPTEGSIQLIPSELGFYFASVEDYTFAPQIMRLANFTQHEIKYLRAEIVAIEGVYGDTSNYFGLIDTPESTIFLPGQMIDFNVIFVASLEQCAAALVIYIDQSSPVIGWLSGKIFQTEGLNER